MPIGFSNTTNITFQNITKIANVTDPGDFFINVNHIVYGGWLYFLLLATLLVIVIITLQQKKDQILNNIMYASAFVTILSFFLRAYTITQDGVVKGMLTDWQMWFFPLISIMTAAVIWATKE